MRTLTARFIAAVATVGALVLGATAVPADAATAPHPAAAHPPVAHRHDAPTRAPMPMDWWW